MSDSYIKLSIAALLPVAAAAMLYLLEGKTPFGKLKSGVKQVIFGIIFGALAIIGTEWGIPMNGAQANCRDAAVMIAGLLFGAPAGIIAGLIGGIERWIAVAWGVGTFTRVACTVSTIIAGFYAAALRKFMFEDKKPGWLISCAAGIVMEVFHLTMVFITNMATPEKAMAVVNACSVPMIIANGVSVMLAAMVLTLLAKDGIFSFGFRRDRVRISQTIQRWLLVTVILAFAVTSYFVYSLQDRIASSQTDSLLSLALDETSADILDASDQNMLVLARKVADEVENVKLSSIAAWYGIAEISIVDENGIITESTNPNFIGFDFASGAQSREFLCLLNGERQYVQEYGPITYDETIMRKYAGIRSGTGFIQIGYNSSQFQGDLDMQVDGLTKNRHVGKTGFILILDERLHLVSSPDEITQEVMKGHAEEIFSQQPNTTFLLPINGVPCYCRYDITEGYCVTAALPVDEALQMRNIALYVNTFMEILVFGALFALIYLLIKRVVVNQIKDINSSLAKITGGDLGVVVDVRSNEEFASLSDDINSTVDTLKRYIDEASARIDAELEFAKNIQASALPSSFPAFPKRKDFDIFASMNPAKEVGGDFYDFYMTDSDKLHFLIADVSGKGIPAAMFMMRAKTELKSLTENGVPINEVFTHGNAALCEGNDAGMFVTAWQGGIDLSSGLVRFANAGHNPPLVRHAADGKFEYLRSRVGFVLAGMDGVNYKTQELQLERGDIVYLYTDGVTEATDANKELYGEDRLLSAINSREFESMEELCRFIKADVDAFVGDAPQFDDITMVALKFIGTPPAPSIRIENAAISDIPAVTEFVEAELEKLDCPMKSTIQINVAIDELMSNIVKYGYVKQPGPVTVSVIAKDDPHGVCIRFEDEGIPYNPLNKEDPDVSLSVEERGIGGLGIFLVKKTMDDIKYAYDNGKNILSITKFF